MSGYQDIPVDRRAVVENRFTFPGTRHFSTHVYVTMKRNKINSTKQQILNMQKYNLQLYAKDKER